MWLPRGVEHFFEAALARLGAIQEAVQEQASAVRNTAETANQTREEISRAIAALHTPADERAKADAYRKKAHRQQVLLTWGTWLAFIAASVAACAAIHYANIAECQLTQMIGATSAAEESATAGILAVGEGQAQFALNFAETQRQTEAQIKAANAAKLAADTARDALKLQNRPWLDIVIQSISVHRGSDPKYPQENLPRKITVKYSIHNYGGGPAIQEMRSFSGEMIESSPYFIAKPNGRCPTLPTFQKSENYKPSSWEAVFPGEDVGPKESYDSPPMRQENSLMRIYGCIVYRGVLDDPNDSEAVHTTELEIHIRTGANDMDGGNDLLLPKANYSLALIKAD